MIVPTISTRKYYDLLDGKTLKTDWYHLYPKHSFERILQRDEITIMIHGLRNDSSGAIKKFVIAKRRLNQLGYRYPVVGFTYDSNTRGAHIKKTQTRALRAGQRIAQKNGRHLARFILNTRNKNSKIRIRLMGHSLGSQVILSAARSLYRTTLGVDSIEAIYLFGSSIPSDTMCHNEYGRILCRVVTKKIVNHYNPDDPVLKEACDNRELAWPLGLCGTIGKPIAKYRQHRVRPDDHRFASYAKVLTTFP